MDINFAQILIDGFLQSIPVVLGMLWSAVAMAFHMYPWLYPLFGVLAVVGLWKRFRGTRRRSSW